MKKLKTIMNKILLILITISLVVFSMIPKNISVYGAEQNSTANIQQQIVDYAKQWVGVTPYVWGGTSLTSGADCSGFVMKIYEAFGIIIPHGTSSLLNVGTEVTWSEIQLGDVIVTSSSGSPTGRHTGIFAGNGQWVNAQSSRTGTVLNNVKIENIITIRRIVGNIESNGDSPQIFPNDENNSGGWTLQGFKPQGEIDDKEIDLDDLPEFEFAGNPSNMEYNGEKKLSSWLFSRFSQFIDYILGMMLQSIVGAIVGWTAIIEQMINGILNLLNSGL